jgi:hypothetical protein
MNDAQDRHGVIRLTVLIDDDVWSNDADAHVRPKRGSTRSARRVLGEAVIESLDEIELFGGRAPAALVARSVTMPSVSASAAAAMMIRAISP